MEVLSSEAALELFCQVCIPGQEAAPGTVSLQLRLWTCAQGCRSHSSLLAHTFGTNQIRESWQAALAKLQAAQP